jgi:gamma-tubulin complex component 3
MFEVMESAWATLQQGLDQAKCLDDVIHAHDLYLNEILERALLSVHHDALNMQVQQMLQSILRFCALEETLLADATAAMTRRLILQKEVEDRTAKGGWGLSDKNLEDASGTFDGVPAYLVTRLDESVKDYSIQFDILMSMLKDQGEKAGEMVRFLTFRLDFNEYYQQQKKIGANIALTSTPPILPPQQPIQSRAREVGQTRLFTDKTAKRK